MRLINCMSVVRPASGVYLVWETTHLQIFSEANNTSKWVSQHLLNNFQGTAALFETRPPCQLKFPHRVEVVEVRIQDVVLNFLVAASLPRQPIFVPIGCLCAQQKLVVKKFPGPGVRPPQTHNGHTAAPSKFFLNANEIFQYPGCTPMAYTTW